MPGSASAVNRALPPWVRRTAARVAPAVRELQTLLLSSNPQQQIRIGRWSIATLIYGLGWWIAESTQARWPIEPDALRVFEWCSLLISVLFYAVLRSGLNLRFAEPSLTVPQIIIAQTLAAYAYVLMSPFRGALLMLQVLALFFALFTLQLRLLWLLCAYGLTLMGATMALLAQQDPQHFDPQQELIHFVLLAAILPAVSLLGYQLTRMRAKLRRQKSALEVALNRIQNLANHDELTGLYSRRFMLEMLHHHLATQTRTRQAATLALIDLDHFKDVNDNYGHRVGDEALRTFARQMQSCLREIDLTARWGGEEFMVLLPHTSPDQAQRIFDRLSQQLTLQPVLGAPAELRIRYSAGLTNLPADESIDRAIERADEALYRAKAQGRNQSVICIGA
jgi:diguanylate cyclase (GGDEF)-like protein